MTSEYDGFMFHDEEVEASIGLVAAQWMSAVDAV